jgi:FlaA1/EpsC-like NDP-sugar epimerase
MRIWLIGAEQAGSEALRQLKKNPAVTVVVSDAVDRPKAVSDGVIAKVDMVENVTPVNINQLARRVRPDLILIDAGAAARAMRGVSGGQFFAQALQSEIATVSEFPCLLLQS